MILGTDQDEAGIVQERDERDIGELQRQGQEELVDLELPSPLELEYGEIDADQSAPEVRAQNNSIERPTEEAHETEAQERRQQHGVQELGHEHQKQENEQENKAHEDGVHEDAAHNDKAQGSRQVDEAQEFVQEDKAYKEGQDGDAYEDDVREYRARKRRVMTEESDDGAALRAQQVREGRKPVDKGKYQRLNRSGSSNYNTNKEDGLSTDDTEEGVSTLVPRKRLQTPRRQPRQDLQAQKRAGAMSAENKDGSTGLTSDFTYEAP